MTLSDLIREISVLGDDLLDVDLAIFCGCGTFSEISSWALNGPTIQLNGRNADMEQCLPEKVRHAAAHLRAAAEYPKEAECRLETAIELIQSYLADIKKKGGKR